jgi:hypothetical protein
MAAKAPERAIFRQNGTWTKPAEAKSVDMFLVAGGGGGGSGGGGENGGTAAHSYDAADLPDQMEVIVGKGGRGVGGGSDGTDGVVVVITHFE